MHARPLPRHLAASEFLEQQEKLLEHETRITPEEASSFKKD
jgi:hypothetical protein